MLCTCESRVFWTSIWLMREVKSVSHPYPQQNILENWLSFVFNYSKGNKKATFKPNRNFIFPLKQFKTPTELSACSKPQNWISCWNVRSWAVCPRSIYQNSILTPSLLQTELQIAYDSLVSKFPEERTWEKRKLTKPNKETWLETSDPSRNFDVSCVRVLFNNINWSFKNERELDLFPGQFEARLSVFGLMRELCMFFGFLYFLSLLVVHLKRKTNSVSFVINSVL